jgi:phosphate transport system substrate-binding protein
MRNAQATLVLLILAAGCNKPAPTTPITIDGSSTVYPLTQAAAELYEKSENATVSVAYSGTVTGFGKFCRGQLDIVNASRPISSEEQRLCDEQGVSFVELPVAHDALTVIVNAKNTWASNITVEELRTLWEPDAEKRVTRWNQVRKDWPDREIALFGPGTESGTFEFFNQVINGGAQNSRKDYTASGDDRVIVKGVGSNEAALGYVGHGAYERDRSELKALALDDLNDRVGPGAIEPTAENVQRSTYHPLSRPLLIYLNVKSAARPEVKGFVRAYVRSARDLAPNAGAVPLMPSTHKLVEDRLARLSTGTIFNVPNIADAWLDLLLTQ